MYLLDYHTHTLISPDGNNPLQDMAQAAVDGGLDELCVTDHYDLLTGDGKREEPIHWAPRLAEYLQVKAQFAGRLTLRLGIEFGSGHLGSDTLTAAPHELDFVIGSLHNRQEKNGGGDFYYGVYDSPQVCAEALDDYFASMALLAPTDQYDVLGHIIYPLRYMERDGQRISLAPWMDQIAEILKVTIAQGRGIEVNTYNGRTVDQWRDILLLYKDLGGEIVTTGSDAHFPRNVGKGIREANSLLEACGFRYLASYERRKPKFIKL